MAVVINEFEVVPAPPPAAATVSAAPAPPPGLSARDIETILQRLHERAVRVRAH